MFLDRVTHLPPWVWAVGVLALAVGRALSFRYQKGMNKYNGPFLASFTNFWRFWQALYYWDRVTYPDVLKYGKVIRLGPNTLLFSEPDAIKDIYTTGFSKVSKTGCFAKSPLFLAPLTWLAVQPIPRRGWSKQGASGGQPLLDHRQGVARQTTPLGQQRLCLEHSHPV
jgi:hypothetical protein